MEIILIIVAIIAVTGLIILIGRALGDPKPLAKFDETPADIAPLDISTGVPVDLSYNPLAEDWDINIPRQMTPEEQEQATKQFERLRVQIEAER